MDHRIGRAVFALVVGLVVAFAAYRWITDPAPRVQRAAEERAVEAARVLLVERVGAGPLEIVDPLAPNRKVGKVYVYAEGPGWAVSGYYRRDDRDRWHPFIVTLSPGLELREFRAEDDGLGLR